MTERESQSTISTEAIVRNNTTEGANCNTDELVSLVSHDLQNPLNVAKVRLTLAQEECDCDHLGEVAHALDRMEVLLDDFLTLSQTGHLSLEVKPVALAEVANDCWRTIQHSDATLQIDTTCTLQADPSKLQQVLDNLLLNSVKHGGNDVTITIGTVEDDAGFYVEDDGPGIPADNHEAIFEPGYSTTGEGNGLGLYIVTRIINAHDWELRVMKGSDGGARFEITGITS